MSSAECPRLGLKKGSTEPAWPLLPAQEPLPLPALLGLPHTPLPSQALGRCRDGAQLGPDDTSSLKIEQGSWHACSPQAE